MESRRLLRVVLAALAFVLPVSAAVVFVVVSAVHDSSRPAGVTHTFQIPAGTKARQDRGEAVGDLLPEQYTIPRGDTIRVINDDEVVHSFGPFTVRPGESQTMTFDEPGYYFGVCTVGDHETVTITVL